MRELPKLAAALARMGARPTYFVNYQAARQPWAGPILRELVAGDRAEIGAHVHPWNTPPLEDGTWPGDTMLCNYPLAKQAAKIAAVTEALRDVTGTRPTSFRAGRFGLGPRTVQALVSTGYRADSSVTPFISWADSDKGPDFRTAPLEIYRIDGATRVVTPAPDGPIAEVPVSAGFTTGGLKRWARLERLLGGRMARALRLPAIAARTNLHRLVTLSPEGTSLEDMAALSRGLVASGVGLLHMHLHSSSLLPGANPFTSSRADVDGVLDRLSRSIEHVSKLGPVVFQTVAEAAATAPAA